ncbi:HAD-IIIA family hydrolase [Candidatus Pelagibacter sp.]|nr:HAD-IIIA family hydrolase [Candidatus Pelagibacter sp.]
MKQAVILAGGQGKRLKKYSGKLPKSMVSLLGKPILQYQIEQCVANNIKNIKLLVCYQSKIIIDYFGDGSNFGASIEYIIEKQPRGTAGALIDCLDYLDDVFLVIYGDLFFDVDLKSFWNFHKNNSSDATIFLHPNNHPYDSDLVDLNSKMRVNKIYSYPHDKSWKKNLVNAAIYILNKKKLYGLKFRKKKPDIAKNLFPLMLNQKKKISGYISTEYIRDAGTVDRFNKIKKDIKSGIVKSLKKKTKKAAIFIDRDGTINREVNHLSHHKQFELIKDTAKAISKINKSGRLSIVVTNQPGIARGDLKKNDLKVIHNKMETLLGRNGAYIDNIYYCPHHTDSGFKGEIKELKIRCKCRKPNTGMFKQAKKELNIDFKKSWVVGDSTRDILAAKRTGMKSVLVKTGYAGKDKSYKINPDYIAKNLNEAVDLILNKNFSYDNL